MSAPGIEYIKRLNTQFGLFDAATTVQEAAKLNEFQNALRYSNENPAVWDYLAVGTPISSSQAGNGASTNYLDTATTNMPAGALFRIVTTVGATPTCTYQIQGSNDHSSWSSILVSLVADWTSFSTNTFVTTTAATKFAFVRPNQPYRYLQVTYSLNTNVTNTTDVIVF